MNITQSEQLLIEMINRARLDPLGEAARFGVDLNEGLDPGTISSTAKQALAPNVLLHASSDAHGQWVIDEDVFSHTGDGGSTPKARMIEAGYTFTGTNLAGENLTYRGSTGAIDSIALMEDHHHKDLFLSEGHRANMLMDNYRELGVSQLEGVFSNDSTEYNVSMVTENFARSGDYFFVTGVAYNDTDGDDFYSIGEGLADVAVTAQGNNATTLDAGGYAISVGTLEEADVTIGGISMTILTSLGNAKIDFVDGAHILTSASVEMTSQAASVTLLGDVVANLDGFDGDDTLIGNKNVNRLSGHGGDDTLIGGGGDDVLYGGDGHDRAVFDFASTDATITTDPAKHVFVSFDGAFDSIYGVEEYAFSDGVFTYADFFSEDPDRSLTGQPAHDDILDGGSGNDILLGDGASVAFMGNAAWQVFRLYEATLGRAPDHAGLENWSGAIFGEIQTLLDAASGFIGSREFETRYGTDLDDPSFVDALYDNVLGRMPSSEEQAAWLDLIEGGMTRAEAVIGFSESREFTNSTLARATDFIESNTDSNWGDEVFRLYAATLDRAPDKNGFLAWTENLGNGTYGLQDLSEAFTSSAEFRNNYGELDNASFVELLYQNVLNRSADSGGLAGWLEAMDNGLTRGGVVSGFAQSREFVASTADDLTSWMRDSQASPGKDTLIANGGSDLMLGGMGSDRFVFVANDGGDHRVMDLEVWDIVELGGFGYATETDALAHFSTQGADVVFENAGFKVTFEDITLASISEDMIEI